MLGGDAKLLEEVCQGPPLGQEFEVVIQVVADQITVLLDGRSGFPNPIDDDSTGRATVGLFSFANQGASFHHLVVQPPSGKEPHSPPLNISPFSWSSPVGGNAVQMPSLRVERTDGSFRITWRDPEDLWLLTTSDRLGGEGNWNAAVQEPVSRGENRSVSL